jgi:hypothetical protein
MGQMERLCCQMTHIKLVSFRRRKKEKKNRNFKTCSE